jgi:hypothetical protein
VLLRFAVSMWFCGLFAFLRIINRVPLSLTYAITVLLRFAVSSMWFCGLFAFFANHQFTIE